MAAYKYRSAKPNFCSRRLAVSRFGVQVLRTELTAQGSVLSQAELDDPAGSVENLLSIMEARETQFSITERRQARDTLERQLGQTSIILVLEVDRNLYEERMKQAEEQVAKAAFPAVTPLIFCA